MPGRLNRPRWTACRSASRPRRWPRSCSGARPGPGCPTTWPASTGGKGTTSAGKLFRLVARARVAGLDPEMEFRAAARRYRDAVRSWEHQRDPEH